MHKKLILSIKKPIKVKRFYLKMKPVLVLKKPSILKRIPICFRGVDLLSKSTRIITKKKFIVRLFTYV